MDQVLGGLNKQLGDKKAEAEKSLQQAKNDAEQQGKNNGTKQLEQEGKKILKKFGFGG